MCLNTRGFFFFLLVVIGAMLLAGCSSKNDAASIRLMIDKGAEAAQDHDIAGILDLATEDLLAQPGDLDRRGIKAVLWRTFQYYGPLRVLYPRPVIDINDDASQASAQLPFLIVKKEKVFPELETLANDVMAWLDAVGENADLYQFTLALKKQDHQWRVYRVQLKRFTGLGFQE